MGRFCICIGQWTYWLWDANNNFIIIIIIIIIVICIDQWTYWPWDPNQETLCKILPLFTSVRFSPLSLFLSTENHNPHHHNHYPPNSDHHRHHHNHRHHHQHHHHHHHHGPQVPISFEKVYLWQRLCVNNDHCGHCFGQVGRSER